MSKYKIEDLRAEAQARAWILLSSYYKNLDGELEYECPNGHQIFTTYRKIRNKYICPICKEFKGITDIEVQKKVPPKKKGVYRILAFDQSTKMSGYAIFDGTCLIDYGTTNIQGEIPARLSKVQEWVRHMVDIWKPDLVGIEDIQLQCRTHEDGVQKITTYKLLAELIGVLEVFLYNNKINYQLVHVSSWRNSQQVKGKYRTDKKRSAQMLVEKCYGVQVTDDEADAILIGRHLVEKTHKSEMIEWK